MKVGGRPVHTRGPVMLAIEIVQIVTSLLAIVALGLAIWTFANRLDNIQTARRESSLDTCYAIRAIVHHAYRRHQVEAEKVLEQSGFGNCVANANRIVSNSPKHKSSP